MTDADTRPALMMLKFIIFIVLVYAIFIIGFAGKEIITQKMPAPKDDGGIPAYHYDNGSLDFFYSINNQPVTYADFETKRKSLHIIEPASMHGDIVGVGAVDVFYARHKLTGLLYLYTNNFYTSDCQNNLCYSSINLSEHLFWP